MATISEKVPKQPGEAFTKLRSDHEQFLEAYEKPTQIYRFLKARHAVKPLFLHRNLSYMQYRSLRRKKTRSRKLKVNDLISFAQQEPTTKHDLAEEIKSDNHLRISFSGLENGIDLESLLENGESSNQEGSTGSHESQLMEVEVLLYQFKQPSAEALMANPSTYPCNCKHLGKLSLTYTPSGATEEGGSHQSTRDHTLTIPESEITWKGSNRMAGTHVLVFKASHCDKPTGKKGHTKKAYHKNLSGVSIELNRLNHSEIATQILKAKQQSQLQSQTTEKASSPSVSSGDTGEHLNSVRAPQMLSSMASSKCSATRTKSDGSDQTLSTVASVATNSSCSSGQRRVKSKVKKEKRDACVMTDITFGTAPIDDLPQPPQIPFMDARPKGKHPSKKASPQSSKSCGFSSPTSTTKEANDKSTSPLILKLSFKNGTGNINGMVLPNGYATEEEMETKSKALASSVSAQNETQSELQQSESPTDDNATTHSINPETGEAISAAEPLPPGSSEEHPLVVSIPRSYYNLSRSSSTSSLTSESSLSYRRGPRLPRRSEIQLLLDGDKPPNRRITAQEIPVFIAEDVSNRTTRSSASQSRGPWHTLGSSTRRITPVEHFVYPFPTLAPKRTSTGNPRKRSLSDSDQPSASSPPPAKQPRTEMEVMDERPSTPKTPPEEEMRDLELRPEPRCLIQTDDVFCAELAMFDSRGYCLLEDGEYNLLMQKCPKRDEDSGTILTFVPLTWDTVFGNGKKIEVEECDLRSLCLKFSVQWTHGPPKNTVNTAFQTALDLKRLREEYCLPRTPSPPPPPSRPPPPLPPSSLPPMTMEEPASESTSNDLEDQEDGADSSDTALVVPRDRKQRIIFNFLYNNNALQQTESQEELRCPWCYLRCGRLYGLLKHMSLSHPRFLFTYSPTEGCPVIDVHVNKLYEAGFSDPDPGERSNLSIVQRRRGPSRCLSSTAVLVERHEKAEEDLSEFLNDGTWKRGYNTNRIYYHSCSILPMLGEEIQVDSEQEDETFRWQDTCSQKMIEEFTDVNRGEKELMKLWNVFAMEKKLIADKQLPLACVKFAKERKKILLEKGLVRNFMTHLISLCDNGLINAGIIRKGMAVIYETSS